MLEFIVLGQVPGTNIYLSFKAIGVVVLGILITYGIVFFMRSMPKHKQSTIRKQTI